MSEPFAKDAKRRARDSQTDTSFEKVWRYECGKNKTMVLKYEGHWVKYSDYAALAAERDALQTKLAKAMEIVAAAKEMYETAMLTGGGSPVAWTDHVRARNAFADALAELKGQDDE